MGETRAWILLVFVCAIARAEFPDRDIDGKRLANRVTPLVLKAGAGGGEKTAIPEMLAALGAGNEFSPASAPERRKVKEWVLGQPDGSIEPHVFFQQCLTASNGNAQKALMLGWDVLREDHWRVPGRNGLELTQKLADITGEFDAFDGNFIPGAPLQRSETIRGDNYSAWYHFYGTALSSYMSGGTLKTKAAIALQANLFTNKYVDGDKRVAIDRAGADFGAALADNLEKHASAESFAASPQADDVEYLFDNPGRWGEKWRLQPGQRADEFGSARASKNGPTMVERIKALRKLIGREDADSLAILRAVVEAKRGQNQGKVEIYMALMKDDPEDVVRAHAIAILGRRRDGASRDLLVKLLASAAPVDRESAIRALGARRDPQLLELATKAIADADPIVREGAIRALTGWRYSPAMDKIFRAVDKSPHVEMNRTMGFVIASLEGDVPPWLRALGEDRQAAAKAADTDLAAKKAAHAQEFLAELAVPGVLLVAAGAMGLGLLICRRGTAKLAPGAPAVPAPAPLTGETTDRKDPGTVSGTSPPPPPVRDQD